VILIRESVSILQWVDLEYIFEPFVCFISSVARAFWSRYESVHNFSVLPWTSWISNHKTKTAVMYQKLDQLNLEWILLDSAVILTFKLSTKRRCINKIHAKLKFVFWIYKQLIMRMDMWSFLNYMQILIWYLFCWVLLVIFFLLWVFTSVYSHLN